MTKILRFPLEKARPATPLLEDVMAHPARSAHTPPNQSGQPAVLLVFPDGSAHLRSTARGYRALQIATEEEPELQMRMTYANGAAVTAQTAQPIESPSAVDALVKKLEDWLVVHVYSAEEYSTSSGYEWSFNRAARAPKPAPGFPYLWTTDFGAHGGLWLFGTPQDLELARDLAAKNDLLRPEVVKAKAGGGLEALRTSSRRGKSLLDFLERENVWVRRDVVWCDCH